MDCIFGVIFGGTAPSKFPVTIEEALLVAVSKNLTVLASESPAVIRARYKELLAHNEFADAALREGLSKKPRVVARLAAAIEIFAES